MGNYFSCFGIQRRNAESTTASGRIASDIQVEDENNTVEGTDVNASNVSNLSPPSLSDQDLADTQRFEAFRADLQLHRPSTPITHWRSDSPRPSHRRTVGDPVQSSSPIPPRNASWSPPLSAIEYLGHMTPAYRRYGAYPPWMQFSQGEAVQMERTPMADSPSLDSPMASTPPPIPFHNASWLLHLTPAYRHFPPWMQFSQNEAVLMAHSSMTAGASLDTSIVAAPSLASPMAASPSLSSPEESSSSIRCPVCLDDLLGMICTEKRVMSTVCGHIFCSSCLRTCIWSNGRCPTCRRILNIWCDIHPIFI